MTGAGREILDQILYSDSSAGEADPDRVISSIMLRAHEYLFAVIFWFVLLGAVGALMYCLVLNLVRRYDKADSGYAGAVRDLHNILMWPSARLLALGFALGGSLVSALESWRTVSGHTLDISREVIAVSGFGALHYDPASGVDKDAGVNTDAGEDVGTGGCGCGQGGVRRPAQGNPGADQPHPDRMADRAGPDDHSRLDKLINPLLRCTPVHA